MKKFCLIGGLGPESTLDYYQLIIKGYQEVKGHDEIPEFLVNSLNVHKLLKMVGQKEYDAVTDYLLSAVKEGHGAGAEFCAIGANTPHIVFNQLSKLAPIPLISIIDATLRKAKDMGITRIGLIGTKFTMEEDFFKNEIRKYHIEPVIPNTDERDYIHEKIVSELEVGVIDNDTKIDFLRIIERMRVEDHIDGLILGCTELPLLLKKEDESEIRFLNTTEIHVESIVNEMIKCAGDFA